MIAGWDIVIAAAAFVLMMAALLPFVPAWAWYAFAVTYAFTRLLAALEHGWDLKHALVLISTAGIAFMGWWYLLRKRRKGECSRCEP
jgi:hypothetical protein